MRSDGLTLLPWAVCTQFLYDETLVDFLVPNRTSAGSVCYPGLAAAEVEEQKIDKDKDFVDDGIFFKR